jgi:signal peptidase II
MKKISIIGLVVLLLDQISKYIIVQTMTLGQSIEVVEGLFSITSHRNQGAAWGMLQGQMSFFFVITGLALVLFYYLYKEMDKDLIWTSIGLGLLIGGTFGNFFDRLFMGEVVDFIDVIIPIIDYDFPIFNVADSALNVGVAIIFVIMFIDTVKEYKNGKA